MAHLIIHGSDRFCENLTVRAQIEKVPRQDICILRLAFGGSHVYYGTSKEAACSEGF